MGQLITFRHSGDFKNTENLFASSTHMNYRQILSRYGEKGVKVLTDATPVDSGKTASAWGYTIEKKRDYVAIVWTNSNIKDGVPVAILLQYGHATRSGGYVQGIDYINPALRNVFDDLAEEAWKEIRHT